MGGMEISDIIKALGGPTAVALACDPPISRQAVVQWVRVPDCHVLRLEDKLGGGEVDRYHMRPDIFGPRPKAKAQR